MVEQSLQLDRIFRSLADPTRRDILKRAAKKELSISEIAEHYDMSFAAIAKHLSVLEKAKLIVKKKHGKQQMVKVAPKSFVQASECIQAYERLWNIRLDALEQFLASQPS